jgi:type IV pilus assembly protein PilF
MKRFVALLITASLLVAACAQQRPMEEQREASQANTRLGVEYMKQGDNTIALEKLKKAVQQDPSSVDANAALGLVYARLHDKPLADKYLSKALDLDPSNAGLLNNYGVFLCHEQRQPQRAEGYFLRAAQSPRYPTPEVAYTNAGVCARKLPDMAKAESFFRQALERNANFPDALIQMALVSADNGNYLSARAFLQRYEAVGPASRDTLALGMRIESSLGNRGDADRYADRLRREFPDDAGRRASSSNRSMDSE